MSRGQRLAVLLAATGAILLLGRGAALLYTDHAWYAALGARSVWEGRATNTLIMYVLALTVGTLFAFVNIAAVRRSVIALVVPKRIGNVEIGEEIPSSRLVIVTAGMSLCVATVSTLALPSWTTLALWRTGVSFGESDPYLGADLSYYVTWLPLESAIYTWAFVLFAMVVLLIVALYGLTPSLSWGRGAVRISTHARRHITILAAILVLFTAWSFHLDTYQTLISSGGAGASFTSIDKEWVVPTQIALSVATVGAAVVLLAAGWWGQTIVALITVSVVILFVASAKIVLPWVSVAAGNDPGRVRIEAPYKTTQQIFSDRAFPREPVPASTRFAADSAIIASAPRMGIEGGLPDIVYPGASGSIVERDSAQLIRAPRLNNFFDKLMAGWAEQNPQLLQRDITAGAAYVRRRELRDRVRAVAPIFVQSLPIGWRPTPTGVVWIVDLYSTSSTYPLSAAREAGGRRITYRHHAATAYVSGSTGAVGIVPDSGADPLTRAWFARYGGPYMLSAPPPELSAPVKVAGQVPGSAAPAITDTAFRAQVVGIYIRMRAALNSGDLRGFAAAFDSLGAAVGAPK